MEVLIFWPPNHKNQGPAAARATLFKPLHCSSPRCRESYIFDILDFLNDYRFRSDLGGSSVPFWHQKSTKIESTSTQDAPQKAPSRAQERLQELPRRHPSASKTLPETPKTPPRSLRTPSKTPPRASKMLKIDPKTPPKAPKIP